MSAERIVRIVAGFFVLLSLSLGVENSPFFMSGNWLWFTAFVGVNLFQSGFTRFCPLEMILKKLGIQQTCQ
ncbi:MAG: sulfurtransferase [Methylomonas sp.]|nr:MAG: sulfurtransferase [Methylomonas sp.]